MKYLFILPILFISIIIHEVSHGFAAYLLGDDTAKRAGRLSFHPAVHVDRFGTLILPALLLLFSRGSFSFGYAKPVPINPMNFKNLKRDTAITAAAGPLSNITVAFILSMIFRLMFNLFTAQIQSGHPIILPIIRAFPTIIIINLGLALFNLIPFPPLDGSKIFSAILPDDQYYKFMSLERKGMMALMLILAASYIFDLNIIGSIIMPPLQFLFKLFTGIY